MGAWGDYDDENDRIADLAYDLEHKLLPKRLADLPTYRERPCSPPRKNCKVLYDDDETLANRQLQRDWMLNNVCKIQTYLNKATDMEDQDWSGISLYIARGWGSTPIGHKLSGVDAPVPALPTNFPKGLREKAYRASVRQLEEAEQKGNILGWKDFQSRKNSLRNQIKLFGAGRAGRAVPAEQDRCSIC